MRTQKALLKIIFLVISIISCVLPQAQGQSKGGLVNVIANPSVICEGGSAQLHAETTTDVIIDFETGDLSQLSQYSFSNDPTYPWMVKDADNGSLFCFQSGNGGHPNTVSTFSISKTFVTSGMVSFDAHCMGEGTYTVWDNCIFQIGNQTMFSYGATTTGWTDYSFYVGPGDYTFTWTYTKDGSVDPTGDYFRIDNIAFSEIEGMHLYGFEDGMQGWTTIDADGYGNAWSRENYSANSGSYCMRASYQESSYPYTHPHNDYLVSPRIQFGGKLVFYAKRYGTGYDDFFRVYVSTTGNNNASYFTTELTNGDVAAPSIYTRYEYDLTAFQGQGYVAIVYTAPANQWYLYVDDITIMEDISTPSGGSDDVTFHWEPGNLTGSDITVTPMQNTTYTVTATDVNGAAIGTAQQTVVVEPMPMVNITTSIGEASICEDDSITLYASVSGKDHCLSGDILCSDSSWVHPSEWTGKKEAKGVVVYVDGTGQHGWAVDLGTENAQAMQWSTEKKNIPGLQSYTDYRSAIFDLDGYSNTQKIRYFNSNPLKYPAAWAVDFENGWYLPSIGQLNILFGVYVAVNAGLAAVGGVPIDIGDLWSSSVSSTDKAWLLRISNGYVSSESKQLNKKVRSVINF